MVYKWSGCKFTADQYAVYKWLGCKFSPSPKGEGLFPYFYRKDGTNEENRVLYHKGRKCLNFRRACEKISVK